MVTPSQACTAVATSSPPATSSPHPHVRSCARQNGLKSRCRLFIHPRHRIPHHQASPKTMTPRKSPNTTATCPLEPIPTCVLQRATPFQSRPTLESPSAPTPSHSLNNSSSLGHPVLRYDRVPCATPKHAKYLSCESSCATPKSRATLVSASSLVPLQIMRNARAATSGSKTNTLPASDGSAVQWSASQCLSPAPPTFTYPSLASPFHILSTSRNCRQHHTLAASASPAIANALGVTPLSRGVLSSPSPLTMGIPDTAGRPGPPIPAVLHTSLRGFPSPLPGAAHVARLLSHTPAGWPPSPLATPVPNRPFLPPATSQLTHRRCLPPLAPTAMSP